MDTGFLIGGEKSKVGDLEKRKIGNEKENRKWQATGGA